MKVEKIKKLKSGKYKIELDNNDKLVTYDDVILNNNLLFDKNLSNELLNKLNVETKYYDIYNRSIKYISIKMRSKLEMEIYLDKLKIDNEDKQKIIDNLINIGLINDLNFTKAFISDKINLSNVGPNKIKQDLLNNNIDINIINEELYKYDENIFDNKIDYLISKKIKNTKYSNYVLKQKILNELLNLGYDKNQILTRLNNYNLSDSGVLDKEVEKLYNKLSKKYSGYELKSKIKAKLYQKGYSLDEINNSIEKRIVD